MLLGRSTTARARTAVRFHAALKNFTAHASGQPRLRAATMMRMAAIEHRLYEPLEIHQMPALCRARKEIV